MPKQTAPSVLQTGALTPASFLDAVVRLGCATVEQVAAAVLRLRPNRVPKELISKAEELATPAGSPPHLSRETIKANHDPIPRRFGRTEYSVGPAGLIAPQNDIERSIVLTAIRNVMGRLGTEVLDGVQLRDTLPHLRLAEGTATLDWLLTDGYLDVDIMRDEEVHVSVAATPHGVDKWTRAQRARRQPPLPHARHPRPDQLVHHLLAVEAALEILVSKGWRLVLLRGDPDLRSEAWLSVPNSDDGKRGSATKVEQHRKKLLAALPDAELVALDSKGKVRRKLIEIISARYSASQLGDKLATLDPRVEVFAPSAAARNAARSAGFPRVHLLDGRPFQGPEQDW